MEWRVVASPAISHQKLDLICTLSAVILRIAFCGRGVEVDLVPFSPLFQNDGTEESLEVSLGKPQTKSDGVDGATGQTASP